jgi:hypothetical protein
MANVEFVSVGCRLPNGLRLEVGFKAGGHGGNGGAPFAMLVKNEDYASHLLRGTNQHLIVRDVSRKPVAVLPNALGREPYINHDVPKAFWERWCKENAKSWHLTSGQIFLVPKNDANSAKAIALDAAAKSSNIFEPLDPSKKMKVGNDLIMKREEEE